jgi:hypothetical protein
MPREDYEKIRMIHMHDTLKLEHKDMVFRVRMKYFIEKF